MDVVVGVTAGALEKRSSTLTGGATAIAWTGATATGLTSRSGFVFAPGNAAAAGDFDAPDGTLSTFDGSRPDTALKYCGDAAASANGLDGVDVPKGSWYLIIGAVAGGAKNAGSIAGAVAGGATTGSIFGAVVGAAAALGRLSRVAIELTVLFACVAIELTVLFLGVPSSAGGGAGAGGCGHRCCCGGGGGGGRS